MTRTLACSLLALAACGGSSADSVYQPITCGSGDTPIYSDRFLPEAGASGVATGADAVAGKTNSEGSSPSGEGKASPGGAPASPPASTPASPGDDNPAQGDGGPLVAMTATCGPTDCAPDQVAVEVPPPAAGGDASGGALVDTTSAPTPSAPPTATATATLICTQPPPACPPGESPQFTSKRTWECTDCALVVTYGGTYGNYRRCVNSPHLSCPADQVPTWVFEDEQWECKPTCDNGQYDRHTIDNGTLVCVPC